MSITSKLKTLFRGDISLYHLPHELIRRQRAAGRARIERASLDELNVLPARLLPEFAKLCSTELLVHFRERQNPVFWPAVTAVVDTEQVISEADRMVDDSTWEVMGFGPLKFDGENCWRRDPLSGHDWGRDYHADVIVARDDGSDIRVLWEVNRFGHAITLALAYQATADERYAGKFFSHVEAWIEQNPYARGANWNCAMEVALRSTNLLAAFDILRSSETLTVGRLDILLKLFDQHGRFIVDNSEFSYIATSNHYLADVVGLFWIGTMMPELTNAHQWRDIGLAEMLSEMDKQVLPDGVDFEASIGYHRFVTEMFLTTFLLARQNGIEIADRYWRKLKLMIGFVRDITRPDGRMPMFGDCDGSRFLPVQKTDADETKFLLDLGELVLDEQPSLSSVAYSKGGIYVFRDDDLYLAFNASDCGVNGRGSHAHNDVLSIEVSAFGVPFIVDPGSYVYNLDRAARHTFRSTAYHSTVMIDDVEQNTTYSETPFIIGNEAKPRLIEWNSNPDRDVVAAEHDGYVRLAKGVTHRRTVAFDRQDRFWTIDDAFAGDGDHKFRSSFHLAPEVEISQVGGAMILTSPRGRLLIVPVGLDVEPHVADAHFSRNYGQQEASKIVSWTLRAAAPMTTRFLLIPCVPKDETAKRLELVTRLADNK